MAIIQDLVGFIDGKTSPKDGIDPSSVKNVPDEKVSGSLIDIFSTIITREVRLKIFCIKVDEKVAVPGVIRGNEEEVFVGEILVNGGSFGI